MVKIQDLFSNADFIVIIRCSLDGPESPSKLLQEDMLCAHLNDER